MVLKKENFELPLTPPDTPAITSVLAAACLVNALLAPPVPLKPEKRVRFCEDHIVRLFLITRSRTQGSPELVLLEPATEPARPILPPKRSTPLLPLTVKDLFAKGY